MGSFCFVEMYIFFGSILVCLVSIHTCAVSGVDLKERYKNVKPCYLRG